MVALDPTMQSSLVDFVSPLSSVQSLVVKSALVLSLHILLFIMLVPQQEQKRSRRTHWAEKNQQASQPAVVPIKPAAGAGGKHERKDSLFS
ncbi:uncharacterized protein BKCO1_430005 [Diplodia corticola]|uniref:Uncharacterized protein n=1 Tax=Diplodia corticola TaxID=236234 RepID=A0A1J9RWK4_9PEZI|nr:uncharacterized protein BKCO1_430005 [Diplodia corticola]OJD31861.1 hypothetical protein BKCO1_430005 [Diplodia corticola]